MVACLVGTAHASPSDVSPAAARVVVKPPPGWKSTPELARTVAKAAGTEVAKVVASEAWAEPSLGCYAVRLQIAGRLGPTDRVARQLIASIQHAGFTVRDVSLPTAATRGLGLAFSKAPYHGQLRAVFAGLRDTRKSSEIRLSTAGSNGSPNESGTLDAVACAWNRREPSICAPVCAKLVEAVQ